MPLWFARRALHYKQPVVLFHTWTVTKALLGPAIREKRSMDLDVCVDDRGNPFLGHPKEYHQKPGEAVFNSVPLWEAVAALTTSNIPVIVDCKHFDARPIVAEVVQRLRPERRLVHSFVSELRFDAGRMSAEPDFLNEWSSIERLTAIKQKFPSITTTASAKWLPPDVLVSEEHETLLEHMIQLLKEHAVETICLNVPDSTFSDRGLRMFLRQDVILHVGVDRIDVRRLSEMYIGETDRLEAASQGDSP